MTQKPTYEELEKQIQELELTALSIKESEEALKNSYKNFQALLNNSSDYIMVADSEGFPVTFNVSYAQIIYKALGVEMKPGLKPHTLLQDKKKVDYWDQLHQRALKGEKLTVEYSQKFDRGEIKHFEFTFTPIIEDDKIKGFTEISRDITQRKQTEEALLESENNFREMAENVNDGILIAYGKGAHIFANKRASEITGYTISELLNTTIKDLAPPYHFEKIVERYRTIISGKLFKRQYETEIINKDGKVVSIEVSSAKTVWQGKPSDVVSFRDITERKQMQRALQEAHNELEHRVKKRTSELEIKTKTLEEINIAMKVLLKKRDEDKKDIEDNVLTNVKELIAPFFKKIKKTKLDDQQKTFLSIIESNINEIISPFTRKMSLKYLNLTPKEIQIANLIRHGSPTKEIAELLNLSPRTIETHRKNIRRKFGLEGKRANLRSHLLSLQ